MRVVVQKRDGSVAYVLSGDVSRDTERKRVNGFECLRLTSSKRHARRYATVLDAEEAASGINQAVGIGYYRDVHFAYEVSQR